MWEPAEWRNCVILGRARRLGVCKQVFGTKSQAAWHAWRVLRYPASRADEPVNPLRRLYEKTGHRCGVFITAFNPLGQQQGARANEIAHAHLGECLRALTPHVIEGAGADPTGAWPPEKSYFEELGPGSALGLAPTTAKGKDRAHTSNIK